MSSKKRIAWLTGVCLLTVSSWAQAQCITLEQLLELSVDSDEPLVERVNNQLASPDWTYRGTSKVGKEIYWTYKDPKDNYVAPDGSSEAWLGMRPTLNTHVVTMKTVFPACINGIRASLRVRKLQQKPITCPDCEATRYESQQYSVDIYDRKKGAYPFIVVVRRVTTNNVTVPKADTTSVRQLATSNVAAPKADTTSAASVPRP